IASLVTYVGYTVALVISMVVVGVDLAGITIIAGALSVGIGFGLQNIVNNFVSGLILLIERPIRPGDRISIGGDEGFVKKISIRSTKLTTLQEEDLIIPNSNLLSGHLINYTYKNNKWLIDVKVGVAYGSDIHKVRQILMDIACAHPEIINEGS